MNERSKPAAIVGKACSFQEMIAEAQYKKARSLEELENNGGMCLRCGKSPAEIDNASAINNFHCIECNKEAQKLVDQLKGSPGFRSFKI